MNGWRVVRSWSKLLLQHVHVLQLLQLLWRRRLYLLLHVVLLLINWMKYSVLDDLHDLLKHMFHLLEGQLLESLGSSCQEKLRGVFSYRTERLFVYGTARRYLENLQGDVRRASVHSFQKRLLCKIHHGSW